MTHSEHYTFGSQRSIALRLLPCTRLTQPTVGDLPDYLTTEPASLPPWLKDAPVVFYPLKTKGPREPGWPAKAERGARLRPGMNVGVLTGSEVTPGQYLADQDNDWSDPRAPRLVEKLSLHTNSVHGRASKPTAHLWYLTDEPVVTTQFKDVDSSMLIELRGTTKEGTLGCQTMVRPSVHPSGESLQWTRQGEPGHVNADGLVQSVRNLAIAMILTKHLGHRGLNHDARLAFAGFLLKAGLSEAEVTEIGEAIAAVTSNDGADMRPVVASTARKIAGGGRTRGAPALAEALGEHGAAVVRRIGEWLGRSGQFETHKGAVIKDSQENVRRALALLEVVLSHDVFAQRLTAKIGDSPERPLGDDVVEGLWLQVDEQFKFRPSYEFFERVLRGLARRNPFHSVQQYLASLAWDGTRRVDTWLHAYGGAVDNDYTRAVGALVLIAAVRRARRPGSKFDELLVLESQQGLLKSSALRTLCPREEWFSDDLPLGVDAKQMIERTAGKWIIEAAELSGMRRSQVEQLKASLSRQTDGPCRMAYGRLPVEQPRSFIIVGTTNSNQYLKDGTGNRRFWPVTVGRFKVDELRRDRDQLWAEAAQREAAGESTRLDPKLYTAAEQQQEERRLEDPWESALQEMLTDDAPDFIKEMGWKVRLTPSQIWEHVLHVPVEKRNQQGSERIAAIMQRLGFRSMTVRASGEKPVRGWGKDCGQADLDL